jgi:hypothetical protein
MRATRERAIGLSEAEAALVTFEQAVSGTSNSVIERDSAILRLIYTFAVIWKACGHLLAEREGIEARSANAVVRAARGVGWLSEEDADAAIAAGRDRDLAFQMYRAGIGEQIEQRLAGHAAVLRRWLDALQERAADGT